MFLAADVRKCRRIAKFQFHSIAHPQPEGVYVTASRAKELVELIAIDNALFAQLYLDRTTLTPDGVAELTGDDTTRAPDWALKHDFVDEVADYTIPEDCPLFRVGEAYD